MQYSTFSAFILVLFYDATCNLCSFDNRVHTTFNSFGWSSIWKNIYIRDVPKNIQLNLHIRFNLKLHKIWLLSFTTRYLCWNINSFLKFAKCFIPKAIVSVLLDSSVSIFLQPILNFCEKFANSLLFYMN